MPKAVPPTQTLKFQGRCDFPPEDGIDDWGLKPQDQETYVELFRRILEERKAWKEEKHDFYMLRRFLRARSYDLEKATLMWMNHMEFCKEFGIDTILQDFDFHERQPFIESYPQGYHKTDKAGFPVYIQLIGKIDLNKLKQVTTTDRMLKFHFQEYERYRKVILPICSRIVGRNVDATFGIMDAKGIGISHFTGEVKTMLGTITKYDQDNYPEMLRHLCIINAPYAIRVIWQVVRHMLDERTQNKIEILGTDYLPGLLKWVDEDSLPTWLGGKSQGTLVDDVGPWNNKELVASLGLDIEKLRLGIVPPGPYRGNQPSPAPGRSFNNRPPTDVHAVAGSGGSQGSDAGSGSFRKGISPTPSIQYVIPENSSVMLPRQRTSEDLNHASHNHLPVSRVPDSELPPTSKRSQSLIDRIVRMERVLAQTTENGNTAASAAQRASIAEKLQGTGTILARVEVLESAVETLLAAQETVLAQRSGNAAARAPGAAGVAGKEANPRCCECCIM